MKKYTTHFLTAALLVCASAALAGGPLNTDNGVPVIFLPSAMPIPYTVDQGTLGLYSNAEATGIVDDCFATWQAVNTARVSFTNTGFLPADVTVYNYVDFFADDDGINPVIFDSDGSIIDNEYGYGASDNIIGFSGSAYDCDATRCFYTEGATLINGRFTYDPYNWEPALFKATFVHEFGHFIGLDHCQINQQYVHDDYTADDIYVPTMFPTATDNDSSLGRLNPDDEAAITMLYPASDNAVNAVYGKLQGSVRWRSGRAVRGANVVAVNQNDPDMNQFSSVSDYFQLGDGAFEMLVTPGTYTLFIEPVYPRFTGGSSVGPYAERPLSPSFIYPVRTQEYDGTVTVAAGQTVSGIDFTAQHNIFTPCPAVLMLAAEPAKLRLLRSFRDRVLAQTETGRRCTTIYYTYGPEVVSLLAHDARLAGFCAGLLSGLMPRITASLDGAPLDMDGPVAGDLEKFCDLLAQKATPGLKAELLWFKKEYGRVNRILN